MDNRCDTDCFVAPGSGEQLHHGRVYSHSADNSPGRDCGWFLSKAREFINQADDVGTCQ